MITQEQKISVGILAGKRSVRGRFNGPFHLDDGRLVDGPFSAQAGDNRMSFVDSAGNEVIRPGKLRFVPAEQSTFTLSDVTIGIRFHWEQKQELTFQGDLVLMAHADGTMTAINEIDLEDYLVSVISSEMGATAPLELLKAHAITSRSWLVSILKQGGKPTDEAVTPQRISPQAGEISKWYGREEHAFFDVCADDHCQRYQGVTRIISRDARDAVQSTCGVYLVYGGNVCDARYHKACGGLTENFENVWDETPIPYLSSISDSALPSSPIQTGEDAIKWIRSSPEVYCNTTDVNLLQQILPSFDQETTDFFRWKVVYARKELEAILQEKTGIDFGILHGLTALERGPSGRIIRLMIEGSKECRIVGKELEIRRWLSRSHLYSSAFIVSRECDPAGVPIRFVLEGAGWGHGVGLCQIGAAVMAARGFSAEDILRHYFRGAALQKCY